MRARTTILTALALGLPAVLLAASVPGGALAGVLQAGTTQHVQVTTNGQHGVVAGLVTTRTTGPFGLDLGQGSTPTDGWVLLAPEDAPRPEGQTLTVTDEMPFEDPNGGTWLSREVRYGATTAWVVPIGERFEDPTLGEAYNFALIVDWGQVPQGASLTASYHETLDLEGDEAR